MRTYGDTCPIAIQAAQGSIALIRICGQGSLESLAQIFSRPQALLNAAGNTVVYGWIRDFSSSPHISPPALIDQVLISVYRAPRSYTGEDGADISCHGGSAAVKAVLEALRKAGFQDALPGEFTFRSFINGKMDLTQSESVMELVSAKSKHGLEHAVKRLSGTLEREIHVIRDKLLEILSALELYLVYPEEEIEEIEEIDEHDRKQEHMPQREEAEDILRKLQSLAVSYRRERLYQEGVLAVIAGRPNAGKSSLFNVLLSEDRSIVTEKPGTTRDWIEAALTIEGIPVRLADTAGIRSVLLPCESQTSVMDEAEIQGIQRSRDLIEQANIILYTVDACEGLNIEDQTFLKEYTQSRDRLLVLVWNKVDLEDTLPESIPCLPEKSEFFSFIPVSCKTGIGIGELCSSIASLIIENTAKDSDLGEVRAGLGTERQKDLTEKAALLLEEALLLADQKEPLDIIAPFLREALNTLGEITGEVSSADILDLMFSRFCLGK